MFSPVALIILIILTQQLVLSNAAAAATDPSSPLSCLLPPQLSLHPHPPQPQDSYGLEKLASEELCMHYTRDFGIECRIARFHNIYGPHGTWKGGREKAPAAFCRKVCVPLPAVEVEVEAEVEVAVAVAEDIITPHSLHDLFCCTMYVCILHHVCVHPASPCVLLSHCRCPLSTTTITPIQVLTSPTEIEMWGDGKQTRSFTFIDDCVEGILRITKSDYREPLNLGSSEMVSMNEMMEMAMSFEGKVGPMKALF